MGYNQHIHIHLSGISDMSEFYHHNNMLLHVSKQCSNTPKYITDHLNLLVKISLEPSYKPETKIYPSTYVLHMMVPVRNRTLSFTLLIKN